MLSTLIIIVLVALGLASLVGGMACLAGFARTRKRLLLVVGLLLTFIVPGLMFCAILGLWIPSTVIVYGPPPELTPTMVVYGPPPDLVP